MEIIKNIVAIHQPAYLPWLGYFDKIFRSDVFIFLDTVQFEKNSFTNRNKIKTPTGALWLTIPVKIRNHTNKLLKEIEIDSTQKWVEKHLKSIHANYKKAKRFNILFPKIENLYKVKQYDYLSDLCFDQLIFWLSELNCNKKLLRSSTLNTNGHKSDLLINLCKTLHATKYVSGTLGKNYLELNKFKEENIEVEFQEYEHPVYEQLWGTFLPNMSIIDFLMNTVNLKNGDGYEKNINYSSTP